MTPVYILVFLVGLIVALSSAIARNDGAYVIPAFVLGLVVGAFYFIPSFIAARKNHPSKIPIITLNALGGWLVIGWIVSIVWAVMDKTGDATSSQSIQPKGLSAVGSTVSLDLTAQLSRLEDMRQRGVLTDEEYRAAKAKLLT